MKVNRLLTAGLAVCLGLFLGFGLFFAQGTMAAKLPSSHTVLESIPINHSPALVSITLPDWWDEEDQAMAHFGQGVRLQGMLTAMGMTTSSWEHSAMTKEPS